MPAARRTCPACARRYAGLIDPDCPICQGTGALSLGAAALAQTTPPAAARAVELFLEASARRARATLPLAALRPALEAAVDEARHAGLLADRFETGPPAHARISDQAGSVDELDALRTARRAGAEVDDRDRAALHPRATAPLHLARPNPAAVPVLSANGHRSQLARTADPIHPLDSVVELDLAHRADAHAARVLALAAEDLITRRHRKPTRKAASA